MAQFSAKTKRKKPNKQRAARVARGEKQALASLAHKRRPFEPLLKEIVAAVVHAAETSPFDGQTAAGKLQATANASLSAAHGPLAPVNTTLSGGGTWLEVGCGLGQLRGLLPKEVLPRMIHTDVLEHLVKGLLEKYPDARARAASVDCLPFDAGSIDAVLGLCAFDSFPNQAAASREIWRVLRLGGVFVHFLDAATNIEPTLLQLMAAGRLPLPNFFADIALRRPDLIDWPRVGHLIQPYHDVLSVPVAQFGAVVEMLRRAGHLMAAMLERYMSVFLRQPFEVLPAARAFVELTSSSDVGRPINQALMSLFTTLQQPPYSTQLPFDVQSNSSLVNFKATLDRYFGPEFGFEVRVSTIVYARSFEPDVADPLRARVRRVGIGQNCVFWPEPRGVHTSRLAANISHVQQSDVSPTTHVLREAAIYCLIAAKVDCPVSLA
jgi:SAM-dependent methyltransferase